MYWFHNLYLGESIEKKAKRIQRKIENGKLTISAYIITFPSNPSNLLDIIPAREILQKGYPKDDLTIVGLAGGRDEAISLVEHIVQECLDETGTCELLRYLRQRENQAV